MTQEQQSSEYEDRKGKLERLLEREIHPYPAQSERSTTVEKIVEQFDDLQNNKETVTLVGRIRSKRTHGNLSFIDVQDTSGRIQVAVSKKELAEEGKYKPFVKLIDSGDFIQVSGIPFITEAGQQSIMASSWILLTKALRNMPTDHFGLGDDDERYRKRYIDFTLSPEKREVFVRRAKFWSAMRSFLVSHDFLEVETPSLEVTTGGAEARPFATYHNDFDLPVYMRISVGELHQKRLMASGFEKTFEIGRVYRNEGSSPNHLQEFTNMEFYWAYADYRDGMNLVKELYQHIAKEVYGKTTFTARGHSFNLQDEWQEIDYVDEVRRQTGIDVLTADESELIAKLDELSVSYDAKNRERLIDNLWKYCRQNIAGPAFLINHPTFLAPLSKESTDKPGTVEKFQPIIAGAEVGNGYSELNNPIDQQERFAAQQKLLEEGDDEAMMPDWDFVEMLEYGMPPTCGFGAGERLFSFFEDASLREVTLFPLMKPKVREEKISKRKAEELYRAKKIVVIADAQEGYGVSANAIGQLGIEIGLFSDEKLYKTRHLMDADERKHYVDAFYGMSNLAGTKEQMASFVMRCHDAGVQVFDFSDIMRRAHSDQEMIDGYAALNTTDINYIAVGAVIPKDFEKEFLSSLELFS